MTTATRLRRNDEAAEIVVLERGLNVSFANCGLPYYVGGVIADRADLLLQTPETLSARFDLDVRVRHEALAIDRDRCVVRVRDHDGGTEFDLRYDSLVLATGAAPVRPPIPGIERARVLRDVADVDAIVAEFERTRPRSAAILGGGFIGLELAENLAHRGLAVTIVERAEQILAPLDPEMAALVLATLEDNGVTVHTHPADHAGYYPGAQQMSLKLIVDTDTDTILGAQGVGGAGIDKRIDVIATAMRGGLLASDLADLELAYAPQYGSAKDPVNMLGMIADNLAAGVEGTVQWHEVDDEIATGR